ncbi:hypothetical protein B0H66DRAFT_305523 [Apodospora peruviana]|uniref:Uncharacterized protein n=1 Tax=Apodospora peruviana TaxID=516989 RepID=A0AAE0M3P3_9PEZI|nr:hypothetical protein B0H66DRAFT_305523 [Apodospora peruviana]
MSPSQTQQPVQNQANTTETMEAPVPLQTLQTTQPAVPQGMDTQKPHADEGLGLRGGDRGGCCPGRFCFIIPCPLPCDCCII